MSVHFEDLEPVAGLGQARRPARVCWGRGVAVELRYAVSHRTGPKPAGRCWS